jgi:carbamoyl-phosphate synthase large subunit
MDSATLAMAYTMEENYSYQKSFVCSKLEFAKMSVDKKLLKEHEFPTKIKSIPLSNDNGVKISKPRFGFGGKGIELISGSSIPTTESNDVIIEDFIEGEEISIDAFYDPNCNFVHAVSRQRIEVTSGEVTRTITAEINPSQLELLKYLERFGPRGPINVQTIVSSTGNEYLMEINPRFGGGSTASLSSGFNMIQMIYQGWILNRKIDILPTRRVEVVRSFQDHVREIYER